MQNRRGLPDATTGTPPGGGRNDVCDVRAGQGRFHQRAAWRRELYRAVGVPVLRVEGLDVAGGPGAAHTGAGARRSEPSEVTKRSSGTPTGVPERYARVAPPPGGTAWSPPA